jgi:hypothetical protein
VVLLWSVVVGSQHKIQLDSNINISPSKYWFIFSGCYHVATLAITRLRDSPPVAGFRFVQHWESLTFYTCLITLYMKKIFGRRSIGLQLGGKSFSFYLGKTDMKYFWFRLIFFIWTKNMIPVVVWPVNRYKVSVLFSGLGYVKGLIAECSIRSIAQV